MQEGVNRAQIGIRQVAHCNAISFFPSQALDALGGFSIDEGGIFFVFLIHSAARCSASSNCSMVIDLLTWFLAA